MTARAVRTCGHGMIGVAVIVGCGAGPSDDPRSGSDRADTPRTLPAVGAVGIDALYVLDSIGNRSLPAVDVVTAAGDLRVEILAESLWLRRDGTFNARVVAKRVTKGRAATQSASHAGRYALQRPVVTDGRLSSGVIFLSRGPNLRSELRADSNGLLIKGYGLPAVEGGVPVSVVRTYRRVPQLP